MVDVFLTSGSSWTVPSNCRTVNWVRCYGAASYGQSGTGSEGKGGYGGGGGAFSQSSSFSTTPGSLVAYSVGTSSTNGGDTWFKYGSSYQCYAQGGRGQTGGQASAGVGVTRYSGGSGGSGYPGYSKANFGGGSDNYGGGGGGGGGGAGPSGNGGSGAGGAAPSISGGTYISAGGSGGGGAGSEAGQGGAGGEGVGAGYSAFAGSAGYAYGGGGGGGGAGDTGGSGAVGGGGLIWINYNPSYVWADDALIAPQSQLAASAGLFLPIVADIGVATGVQASTTTPQLFASALLSALSGCVGDAPATFKGLQAGLPIASFAGGRFSGPVNMFAGLSAGAAVSPLATYINAASAALTLQSGAALQLSQEFQIANFATLQAATGMLVKPNIPGQIRINWPIGPIFGCDVFPAQFISAGISAELLQNSDIAVSVYQWDDYGAELLYASASGLERAMADVDSPRLVQMDAEAIIDSWDPYAIEFPLLPYLAWAMGVNFWNDKWSEQTKRDWVAAQWQFKALRGSNAGIEMAVQFAGRDVSPYGYSVRQIITAPQGQFPGPGPTRASQEAWLESLPQVRVYNFQTAGQALADEWYSGFSWLGTGHTPVARLLFGGMAPGSMLLADAELLEVPNINALLVASAHLLSQAALLDRAQVNFAAQTQLIPVLPLQIDATNALLAPRVAIATSFTQLFESTSYLWAGVSSSTDLSVQQQQLKAITAALVIQASLSGVLDVDKSNAAKLVVAAGLVAQLTQIMSGSATLVATSPASATTGSGNTLSAGLAPSAVMSVKLKQIMQASATLNPRSPAA